MIEIYKRMGIYDSVRRGEVRGGEVRGGGGRGEEVR